MIEQIAVVAAAREPGQVLLRARDSSACARCARGQGCGGGVFGKLVRRGESTLRLGDPGLKLAAGELVVLGVDEAAFLRGAVTVYLLPLVGLLAGGMLGLWAFGGRDLAAVAGGLVGFGLGVILPRRVPDTVPDVRILRRASATEGDACSPAG